jgi:hypothetical protein
MTVSKGGEGFLAQSGDRTVAAEVILWSVPRQTFLLKLSVCFLAPCNRIRSFLSNIYYNVGCLLLSKICLTSESCFSRFLYGDKLVFSMMRPVRN